MRPSSERLDFGRVEQNASEPHRRVQLLGPPLARDCVPHPRNDWIHVVVEADTIDVSVDTRRAGSLEGTLALEGSEGNTDLPVRVDVLSARSPLSEPGPPPSPQRPRGEGVSGPGASAPGPRFVPALRPTRTVRAAPVSDPQVQSPATEAPPRSPTAGPLAPLRVRLAARFIDYVLVFLFALGAVFVTVVVVSVFGVSESSMDALANIVLALFLLGWGVLLFLYDWLFLRYRGATFGKLMLGIRVVPLSDDWALRRFVVRGNAAIDYVGVRPETRGETSRLTGQRVDVFFSRDAMDSLIAVGKARNEYQAVPREGRTPESNRAEGDTITVHFVDRKVDLAIIEGTASGEYRFAVAAGDTAAARAEVVRYDAPRIDFIVPKDRIVLDQRSHLIYKEMELRAKRVEFDSERQTLVATGEPKLVDRGEEVAGHLMSYDLETRTGNIYQAETAYEKGLYHGRRIRKVGDRELEVMDGSYSTCENDPPHYRFASHRMKVYLKDKLVAKPVVFYVKNVPLLALPFYLFPIKPGRHSGFLFPQMEFGFNNQSGQFIRNAGYYWAPNDYFDFTASGDYYQAEPSWVVRGDAVYKLLYRLDGRVTGSFARSELDQDERWSLSADHSQELGARTRLVARADFVSSRDYRREAGFGTPLAQRLDRFLTSSLSFAHYASWASLNVLLDRRQDLDADEILRRPGSVPGQSASLPNLVESAPSVSITFPTRTLGTLGLLRNTPLAKPLSTMYFSLNSRYLRHHQRTGFLDDSLLVRQRGLVRSAVATNAALSDSRRLFGWLNMSPAFNVNNVVFDRDELGNRVVPATTWGASMTASTTLYGSFRPTIGPLIGLRHVVFPSVSVSYSPDFEQLTYIDANGIRQQRFRSFGSIGISGFKSARMSFTLAQRLQAKLKRGDVVTRLDNLLPWDISGSYNFLWREQLQRHPLSTLTSSVRLQPPGFFGADVSWVTDVYSERPIRSLGYNLWLSLSGRSGYRETGGEVPLDSKPVEDVNVSEPWTVNLAFSSSGGYGSLSRWVNAQTLNGVAHYPLTRSWRLDYSASYDVTNHELLTQRIGLTRDLHCWQASFHRTFNPGGEAEYYFRLGIKEQKEIYIERGSREMSFGGIR